MAALITCTAPRFVRHAGTGARNLATAAEAASQMMRTFEGRTKTYRETLDGHQLQKLSLTLNRTHLHPGLDVSSRPPPTGTPLPPGYHLVYFTPPEIESDLGPDGTDRAFNAPAPFSRRMWAGGRMQWQPDCFLRVGEEVEERTKLVGATAKKSRDGNEMVLVDVQKELWGKDGLALVDKRSWMFRPRMREVLAKCKSTENVVGGIPPSLGFHSTARDVTLTADGCAAAPERLLKWSPVALFRFSALTFNAHMIHYNESWTRNVEGHCDVVVHGPLNLICMMDYWRDVHGAGKEAREISYRALSPLYAGDEYAVRTGSVRDVSKGTRAWDLTVGKDGQVCMKGTIASDL